MVISYLENTGSSYIFGVPYAYSTIIFSQIILNLTSPGGKSESSKKPGVNEVKLCHTNLSVSAEN